jgi:hypothetical protein
MLITPPPSERKRPARLILRYGTTAVVVAFSGEPAPMSIAAVQV